MKAISEKKLLKIINTKSDFELCLRGFGCVDRNVNIMVNEGLPFDHKLELERMSFILKIDLLIGLGYIHTDWRSSYVKLNAIRNKMAHNLEGRITRKDVSELSDNISKCYPIFEHPSFIVDDTKKDLRTCVAVIFECLSFEITKIRDEKVRGMELHKEVNAMRSKGNLGEKSEFGRKRELRIQQVVEKERKRRQDHGDY